MTLIKTNPLHTHSFFSASINCLSSAGVINELKLCDSFAFGDSPQKETMWLLSSWTNFLVTASSIICFTCQSQRQTLCDSFINVPQLFMSNSHKHTHTERESMREEEGLLVTVWLSAKKNIYILEHNSCKRGKWWEGSAKGGNHSTFEKLRGGKKKKKQSARWVGGWVTSSQPKDLHGENGNVTCEFKGGETWFTHFTEHFINLRGRNWFSCINGWWWHRIYASPTSRRRSDARARKVTFDVPPSRWPENSYRPMVRRLINQSLRWLWRRSLLCNLHGEY